MRIRPNGVPRQSVKVQEMRCQRRNLRMVELSNHEFRCQLRVGRRGSLQQSRKLVKKSNVGYFSLLGKRHPSSDKRTDGEKSKLKDGKWKQKARKRQTRSLSKRTPQHLSKKDRSFQLSPQKNAQKVSKRGRPTVRENPLIKPSPADNPSTLCIFCRHS